MATITRCDKCGIERGKYVRVEVDRYGYNCDYFDLCKDCVKILREQFLAYKATNSY